MHNKIRNVYLFLFVFAGGIALFLTQSAKATYDISTQDVTFSTTAEAQSGQAISDGFTFQGYLTEDGQPANGVYDFEFRLFNAAAVGVQIGNTDSEPDVEVVDGIFSVVLSPGPNVFNKGETRWLEIRVRDEDADGFVKLNPRQEIRPVPQAIYAKFASNLIDTPNTIVHVSAFDMIQSDGRDDIHFAARGNGRLDVTRTGRGSFVYIPVDIASIPFGNKLELKQIFFCYSGATAGELGTVAGIREVSVRQINGFSMNNLIQKTFVPSLSDHEDCVAVNADKAQPIDGSLWVRFEIIANLDIPLQFGEIYLTLASPE
ncbi:MAG: hypothetical protein AAF614_23235 [Chloroflexota bacterium]